MKRLIAFIIALTACSILLFSNSCMLIKLDPGKIELVNLYCGGVPADARRKTVTERDDVERIVKYVNKQRVSSETANVEPSIGGIGLYIEFVSSDGNKDALYINHDWVAYKGKLYNIRKPHEIESEIWASYNYKETLVGEDGLPDMDIPNDAIR